VRCNDGASKAVTTIKTNSVTTSRAVDLDLSSIGCEALSGVFCGDSALEGKASGRDVILSQAKLLERCTSCDLNLRRNNVDTGDLLGDGVLDLNTGVDLQDSQYTCLMYKCLIPTSMK
jgi:hypothetical protein